MTLTKNPSELQLTVGEEFDYANPIDSSSFDFLVSNPLKTYYYIWLNDNLVKTAKLTESFRSLRMLQEGTALVKVERAILSFLCIVWNPYALSEELINHQIY